MIMLTQNICINSNYNDFASARLTTTGYNSGFAQRGHRVSSPKNSTL